MSGGPYDSSLTRVQPTFEQLFAHGETVPGSEGWLKRLIFAGSRGAGVLSQTGICDAAATKPLRPEFEYVLEPPRKLLEYYLNHPERLTWPTRRGAPKSFGAGTVSMRKALIAADPDVRQQGLAELDARASLNVSAWFVFEGATSVDVVVPTTTGFRLVAEGKRTEPGLTGYTEWDPKREQVYRNLDAAHDAFGTNFAQLLIVEEGSSCEHEARDLDRGGWRRAAQSMPHRSEDEVRSIWERHYAGWTTWQAIQRVFPFVILPERT